MGGRFILAAAMIAMWADMAAAQTSMPPAPVEQLEFDRPEAWALKYFISTTALSGLEVPEETRPGSIGLGIESGWIPTLTDAQQRVGFDGTAPQDLNKSPVMLRPRITLGLPGRLAVTVAGNPPIRTFGVTPRLFAAAVEWAAVDDQAWRLAIRGHGQTGTATGAFTCSAAVAASPPGSFANPTGCDRESSDVATLRYVGAELRIALRMLRWGSLTPHLTIGANAIDASYQLNADAFGQIDRTRLETSGVTPSTSAGFSTALSDRVALAVDAYYVPLTVRRSAGAPRTIDSLVNARALLVYRLRR
jgi:hypothetical protein